MFLQGWVRHSGTACLFCVGARIGGSRSRRTGGGLVPGHKQPSPSPPPPRWVVPASAAWACTVPSPSSVPSSRPCTLNHDAGPSPTGGGRLPLPFSPTLSPSTAQKAGRPDTRTPTAAAALRPPTQVPAPTRGASAACPRPFPEPAPRLPASGPPRAPARARPRGPRPRARAQ